MIDWEENFTIDNMCELLLKRIEWTYDNLSTDAKIFVNFRDFPFVMQSMPERIFSVVQFLATLPVNKRPYGLIHEEPTGRFLPKEYAIWCLGVRRVMNSNNWKLGRLLVHVHEKWGLSEMVQLECLSSGGANGIWASVCEEGAALGHACSTVTLMNLVR